MIFDYAVRFISNFFYCRKSRRRAAESTSDGRGQRKMPGLVFISGKEGENPRQPNLCRPRGRGTRCVLGKASFTTRQHDNMRTCLRDKSYSIKYANFQADSGGPLMVDESEGTMVVGVVSTGIGCGRPRLPGLYTRMSEYMPWILRMIQG